MTTNFDFNLFINNIVSMFQHKADKKNLSFSVTVQPFKQWVNGDKNYLGQIINTLLTNAIKYTDKGSVTLRVNYANELLLLIVSDTGCGISEADQAFIFGSFAEINHVDFSEHELGLAISNELIQLMDGSLSIDSNINQGSEFKLSIPLPFANEPANQIVNGSPNNIKIAQANHTNNKCILIADDNEINILLLSFMLDELNHTYDTAVNGTEALSLLVSRPYQLALIDLNMPIMDGIELVSLLRNKKMPIPCIAISAYADKNKIAEALSAGFDDYITKPFDENKLSQLISRYL